MYIRFTAANNTDVVIPKREFVGKNLLLGDARLGRTLMLVLPRVFVLVRMVLFLSARFFILLCCRGVLGVRPPGLALLDNILASLALIFWALYSTDLPNALFAVIPFLLWTNWMYIPLILGTLPT